MFKRFAVAAVSVLLVGAGVCYFCPGLWVQINQATSEMTGWSEEARQADPVGFVEYASGKLRQDLESLEQSRRGLAAEIGQFSDKLRQQQALRDQARRLAEEFRTQYQSASASEGFPIVVRNAAYTEEQVKAQVSMLLAEAEGYETALSRLNEVKKEAESQLEALTVRINTTEAQLAAMSTQRELLRAKVLSDEGQKLLTQVDALLADNQRLIEGNPVRNVRDLLAASSEESSGRRKSAEAVEAFLAEAPAPAETITRGQASPNQWDGPTEASVKPTKRIFQQF